MAENPNTDRIIQVESGGNPNDKNPNSSATGLGQFIDATWLSMMNKYRPDLTEGKSKGEILAMRTNPDLSREMTANYANENGTALTAAGFEANPGNTYLAHFAGPGGAIKVLKADPSTPISAVLGDRAVAANPFMRNMTAGDLQAWASRKMGTSQGPVASRAAAAPSGVIPLVAASPATIPTVPEGAVASYQPPRAVGAPMSLAPPAMPSSPLQASATMSIAPPAQQQAQEQPQQAPPDFMAQLPAEQGFAKLPPIFTPQRRPVNISALRAALQNAGNRGFYKG